MERGDKVALVAGGVILAALGILGVLYRKAINYQTKRLMGSKYITIDDLCHSDTANARGISNTPSAAQRTNMEALIDNLLTPICERLGFIPTVSSGFRCAALNKAVGGASTSQHLDGKAADLTGSAAEVAKIFEAAVAVGTYDQLIYERKKSGARWVHVSYDPARSRRRILATRTGGAPYTDITACPARYKEFA